MFVYIDMICDNMKTKMNVIQFSNYSMLRFISSVHALMFLMVATSKMREALLARKKNIYIFLHYKIKDTIM